MAFCKICSCGTKTVFEKRMSYPVNCPACGRRLSDFNTYNEDDPALETLMKRSGADKADPGNCQTDRSSYGTSDDTTAQDYRYVLQLNNETEIEIPDEGCIIGRTEKGAEELAQFASVSRQHLRMTPRRRIGVIIEDLSTYGTFVNGKKIEKNMPVRVESGSLITLADLEARLLLK